MIRKLRRPPATAGVEERKAFMRSLVQAMDFIGVMPGQEFVLGSGRDRASSPARVDQHLGTSTSEDKPDAQLNRVLALMIDGEWRTPRMMEQEIGDPWASISARLRDLRKKKFGGYTVERSHVGSGLYEYRLLTPDISPSQFR